MFTPVAWPAPPNVRAIITHRGSKAPAPFGENNLALHVGDDPLRVSRNRKALAHGLNVSDWQWLEQIHGTDVVEACADRVPCADGAFTTQRNLALAVLTADCLPVLLCDKHGAQVAAVHAGWRGLAAGIIERAVQCFSASPEQLMAYLGPAICSAHFEVDAPVLKAFTSAAAFASVPVASFFAPAPNKAGYYHASLTGLARAQLNALGVTAVFGGGDCTFEGCKTEAYEADEAKLKEGKPETGSECAGAYYSYRQQPQTGRFATVIWAL